MHTWNNYFCICINWGIENDKSDAHQANNTLKCCRLLQAGTKKMEPYFYWVNDLTLNFNVPF